MNKTIYDIFISYRREGGGATAGRINDMLTSDGYSVSYDVDTLREGRFDQQLLERIEQCQDFILVVDKNCFVRMIDPSTDPQNDWLWQELSYALQLKKNVIPVLLAGTGFPKKLPEDIDNVRFCNGPKCVHEYFDSFYTKLKEMLRAYPRLTKPSYMESASTMKNMPCLKLKADIDCIFYLDGEERSHLKAGILQKFPLAPGEYELMFVSTDNVEDRIEMVFEMPETDKLQRISLSEVINIRLQKEIQATKIAEEKRLAEEKRKAEEQRQAELRRQEAERKAAEERKKEEERRRLEENARLGVKEFTVKGVLFKMIRVEGGSFMMGANDLIEFNGLPPHQVTLSDYFMGETPVTQALWHTVMNSSFDEMEANYPVTYVSWKDCQKFIQRLNLQTGMKFSLPTEAQWEYAARGGKKSQDFKYAGSNKIEDVAWYEDNSGDKIHPVKRKKTNELGLCDMSGNVWEWCQDWDGNYSRSSQTNPIGPLSGDERVLRGGSWNCGAMGCHVSYHDSCNPGYCNGSIGFRLALL